MAEKRVKRERTENDEKIVTMFKHMLLDLKLSQNEIGEKIGDEGGGRSFNVRINRGESNTIQSLLKIVRAIDGKLTLTIEDDAGHKWNCELK